jgi:TadE-like protein
VEAALTLPLVIFLVLGTLQLFMMLQGRIMAEYAAFQAVRAGSRNHGDCEPMVHAALAGLLPSVTPYLGGKGKGSAAEKLASAWKERIGSSGSGDDAGPRYAPGKGRDGKHNGPIFWLVRESPRAAEVESPEDSDFDLPRGDGSQAMRLEVRLIYWYRLRIPFADWVISRMMLAHLGLKNYDAANPLNPADAKAGWEKSSARVINLDPLIRDELSSRVGSKQYVFPIQATYGMRMMTPARAVHFEEQNCSGTPEGL